MSEELNKKSSGGSQLPILYSLRNCPYAMRARIAIVKAQQTVLLRDLVLSNKPPAMLTASPKGTVPVVVLENGEVIEQSLDVMLWALKQTDPDDLLQRKMNNREENVLATMLDFIQDFDTHFKARLDDYQCAKRYHGDNLVQSRAACEHYLQQLELRLTTHRFLFSHKESIADIAIMPFIRKFARIERQWYLNAPYPKVRAWLDQYLQSVMFSKVMAKHPLWMDQQIDVLFGAKL